MFLEKGVDNLVAKCTFLGWRTGDPPRPVEVVARLPLSPSDRSTGVRRSDAVQYLWYQPNQINFPPPMLFPPHGMPRHAFHLPCSDSILSFPFLLSFTLFILLSLYAFISSFQKDIRGICTEIKHRLHGGTTAGIIGSSLISDTKSSVQRFVVVPRNCFNINLRYLWIAISLSAYVNASLPLSVFMHLVFMSSLFYGSCISYLDQLIYSDIVTVSDFIFYSIFKYEVYPESF